MRRQTTSPTWRSGAALFDGRASCGSSSLAPARPLNGDAWLGPMHTLAPPPARSPPLAERPALRRARRRARRYIHRGLEISRSEAERMRQGTASRVQAGRKLLLMLDLDHTLLNSSRFGEVDPEGG